MSWHYALEDERKGPVDESAISTLIGSGVITRDTLVWRQGMSDWTEARNTPLGRYFPEAAYAPPRAPVEEPEVLAPAGSIPRREVALTAVLVLVTCGIYGLYLLYKWSEEINTLQGKEKFNPALVILVSIVTCGIGAVVYHSIFGFELEKLARAHQLRTPQSNLGALVLGLLVGGFVLGFLGLPAGLVTSPVAYALIQAELNKFAGNE